ncbi:putative endonuclease [Aequitasia blattaphilus]|uniref:UPF0102 protein NK125_04165 n=1 Tax=Aequitasia blattaphilus TaxID=2949332 RepID=A0ABT1E715_9FIRM|nr:YraN family protein [Aequitasia blattaphilus]MCP1101609.1 YraN family protein [Aequitasia blattaphilus]MCR8614249.1 YraN family protein [Aequitasia blattaphilus]
MNNRAKGTYFEQKAGNFLHKLGYKIVEFNYRCPIGEVDIIAFDDECLVFVEVKYRKGLEYGSGLEAVDYRKQKKLSKCLLYYLAQNKMENISCRFDVIGIHDEEISLIQDAFHFWGN